MDKKVVIVGAGGHAKVIVDIIRQAGNFEIAGLVDREDTGKSISDIPVIGSDRDLKKIYNQGVERAFIAIGDNGKRTELAEHAEKIGYHLINAISPDAYLSSSVDLGKGIAVMPGVTINPDTIIGDNSIINTGSTIDHDCLISKNVHIAPGCNLAGRVTIGEGVFMGIGCKCIPEVSVGAWSVLGAGSVVLQNIPAYSVAFGVPAKIKSPRKRHNK